MTAENPTAPIVTICYTNWRGETALRKIVPRRLWYGSTEWHREPGWLLDALDVDKGEERTFAMRDVHFWKDEEPHA